MCPTGNCFGWKIISFQYPASRKGERTCLNFVAYFEGRKLLQQVKGWPFHMQIPLDFCLAWGKNEVGGERRKRGGRRCYCLQPPYFFLLQQTPPPQLQPAPILLSFCPFSFFFLFLSPTNLTFYCWRIIQSRIYRLCQREQRKKPAWEGSEEKRIGRTMTGIQQSSSKGIKILRL